MKNLNIAIIGHDIAALTAAYILCHNDHHVTLLEHLTQIPLSANADAVCQTHFDAPFRVLNPTLWPNTVLLAELLGINLYPVHTHLSCSWLNEKQEMGETWLKTGRLGQLQTPFIAHTRFQKYTPTLAWGAYRFKVALQKLPEISDDTNLQTWLQQQSLPPSFWSGCLLPILLTLCSCNVKDLMQWPAKPLLHFCDVMLQGEGLYRLHGDTAHLANTLQTDSSHLSLKNIQTLWQENEQICIKNDVGQIHCFDHVILANAMPQTDFLDQHQFAQEKNLLSQLSATQGTLITHQDTCLMPKNKQDWGILNYVVSPQTEQHALTVWLNPIEATLKHADAPLFQTWQSLIALEPAHIIEQTHLIRAIVTPESLQCTRTLQQLQKQANPNEKRLWFCGSWLCDGLPTLEAAITSAIDVCNQLGAAWPRLFEQDAHSS